MTRRYLSTRMVCLAGAFLLAMLVAMAAADSRAAPGHVYYQVFGVDGTLRDLHAPPRTNEGIKRVVRIGPIEHVARFRRVLSTCGAEERASLKASYRDISTELKWDGEAWVAPAAPAAGVDGASAPRRASTRPSQSRGAAKSRATRIRELTETVTALRGLVSGYEQTVSDARKQFAVTSPATTQPKELDTRSAAADALLKARKDLKALREALADYDEELLNLASPAGANQAVAAGQLLDAVPTSAPSGAVGLRRPTGATALPHYRTQVWPLPTGQGRRTYVISIAHARAGPRGEFRYVAYADTDGDGAPDTLIARSKPARSATAGGWTSWSFTTSHRRVFAGSTWVGAGHAHFQPDLVNETGEGTTLGDEIYVSGFYGALPTDKRKFWPYLHNVRVRFEPAPVEAAGEIDSEVIIRRRP
ncbi:MAG: hypothetical protein J7M14_01545 [Planctomycetes bacterium]|nr:hypothetical protein [Planctomycetota bacterium]